jgi:hypothetical protein
MKPAGRVERWARRALPFALAAAMFAIAAFHVIAVARWAGQQWWASVLIAGTGELMAIAAVLEIRHRRRTGGGRWWPVLVTVAAVVFSAAANLEAAGGLDGAPGRWRPVMAVWPVIAFALVTVMHAAGGRDDLEDGVEDEQDGITDSEDSGAEPIPPSLAASLSARVLHAVPDPDGNGEDEIPEPYSDLDPALVRRARTVIRNWPTGGKPPNRDRLRKALGTSTDTATVLWAYLRESGQVAS